MEPVSSVRPTPPEEEHELHSQSDIVSPQQSDADAPNLKLTVTNPRKMSPKTILSLQRTYGNQVVQRLIKGHRSKTALSSGSKSTAHKPVQDASFVPNLQREISQVNKPAVQQHYSDRIAMLDMAPEETASILAKAFSDCNTIAEAKAFLDANLLKLLADKPARHDDVLAFLRYKYSLGMGHTFDLKVTDDYKKVIPKGEPIPQGIPNGVTVGGLAKEEATKPTIYIHTHWIKQWVATPEEIGNLIDTINHELKHVEQVNDKTNYKKRYENSSDEREFEAYTREILLVAKDIAAENSIYPLPNAHIIRQAYETAKRHYDNLKEAEKAASAEPASDEDNSFSEEREKRWNQVQKIYPTLIAKLEAKMPSTRAEKEFEKQCADYSKWIVDNLQAGIAPTDTLKRKEYIKSSEPIYLAAIAAHGRINKSEQEKPKFTKLFEQLEKDYEKVKDYNFLGRLPKAPAPAKPTPTITSSSELAPPTLLLSPPPSSKSIVSVVAAPDAESEDDDDDFGEFVSVSSSATSASTSAPASTPTPTPAPAPAPSSSSAPVPAPAPAPDDDDFGEFVSAGSASSSSASAGPGEKEKEKGSS